MNTITFIKRLEKNQSPVFTTQQLAVLLETNIDTAAVKLNRFTDKKVLIQGRWEGGRD